MTTSRIRRIAKASIPAHMPTPIGVHEDGQGGFRVFAYMTRFATVRDRLAKITAALVAEGMTVEDHDQFITVR